MEMTAENYLDLRIAKLEIKISKFAADMNELTTELEMLRRQREAWRLSIP